jgi:hypothetical protein
MLASTAVQLCKICEMLALADQYSTLLNCRVTRVKASTKNLYDSTVYCVTCWQYLRIFF